MDGGSPKAKRPRLSTRPQLAVLPSPALPSPKAAPQEVPSCPYMHTIDLKALDFDFEKLCSVSLSSHNVYACLVCGKYFQGRGPSSHAFAHALDASHHIFLNLATEAAYSLPDNTRLHDPLLERITCALRPRFSPNAVAVLDSTPRVYRTLDGERHTQGVTPLDNLHASHYANVVFQVLAAVAPVRDYLLLSPHGADARLPSSASSRVVRELAALVQKIWSPAAFRGHISPHEIMQEVSRASGERFSYRDQSEPSEFFAWIVHLLQREVGKVYKAEKAGGVLGVYRGNKNLVRDCFQGVVEVTRFRDGEANGAVGSGNVAGARTSSTSSFWFLALDLPPKPLFKDASERTLVTQVPLSELLKKYDGVSKHHVVETGESVSYRIVKSPRYLVLTLQRVSKTKFVKEKNPAVVHCPVTGLDMSALCTAEGGPSPCTYDLAAVVIREGPPEKSLYRTAISHAASGKWYSMDHLKATEVLPQLVSLSESCMLLYKKVP